MPTWTARHLDRNRHIVEVRMAGRSDHFDAFLASDLHLDHPDCQRRLLQRDLDEAKRRQAPAFFFGDTLCLMQNTRDFRATKGKTRPEHEREDYIDAVTDEAAAFLEPYKEQLALLADGNHETSHVRHSGIDVTRHLADKLKAAGAPHVGPGAYTGYVRFCFRRQGKGAVKTVDLFYHHGFGRGAPATKGVLKANYLQQMAEADIYYQGHDHNRWALPEQLQRLDEAGNIVSVPRLHVHGGSYKISGGINPDHYRWDVEKMGAGVRPLGGYFVRFWYEGETLMFDTTDRSPSSTRKAA